MKVLKQREHDLFEIEYYDKITGKKILLSDVNNETIEELKRPKKDEDNYRRQSKKYLCSLEEMHELGCDIAEEADDLDYRIAKLKKKNAKFDTIYIGQFAS